MVTAQFSFADEVGVGVRSLEMVCGSDDLLRFAKHKEVDVSEGSAPFLMPRV